MGKLLTVGEAADILSVDPETVREWLRQGRLPGAKLAGGRQWRIEADALVGSAMEAARNPVCVWASEYRTGGRSLPIDALTSHIRGCATCRREADIQYAHWLLAGEAEDEDEDED